MTKSSLAMNLSPNRFRLAAIAAALFICTSASAQYLGSAVQIQSSFAHSSSVAVSDTNPVYLVQITLIGMTHGRSGDLHATLSHSDPHNVNVDVDLFSRPGVSSGAPFGATSSTSGNYSFADSAVTTFSAAAIAAGGSVVPNGVYHPSTSDGTATPVPSFLAAFNGNTAAGTWTLTMSDGAGGFDGSLDGWRLDLVTILPPLSISLQAANTALLSWPTNAAGVQFQLQANTNLASPGWTNVANAVSLVNGTNQVPVSPVTGNCFFRLSYP